MKTILLNGSPKGNLENSGSYFLARAFVSEMREPCEIWSIARENRRELLEAIRKYERIILITPNYVHSVPGGTLEFLYALSKAAPGQCLGFIIQSGYPESSESEIVSRFFQAYASHLGYGYLGTAMKGECAGIALMPRMFKKLKKQFAKFGALYEQTGRFDEGFAAEFAKPYRLSGIQMRLSNRMSPIGNMIGWHRFLKANHAFDRQLDTPYLD